MTALGYFRETPDLVIALPRALLLRGVGDLVDEISQQADIALLPQQETVRGFAITPGASGFLVILLDRFRQR